MIEPSSVAGANTDTLPTAEELKTGFLEKHGSPETFGWIPRRMIRHGYYLPADVYESLVNKLVTPGCAWLDVGGGSAIFPENPGLARELAARSERVTAVDPSENVRDNPFAQERVQCLLEDYSPGRRFDLATMRMVVEHVPSPEAFVGSLARLVKPNGAAVVFTVNRNSPVSWLSRLLPFRFHHPVKRLFWGGEEKDTFPVHYRMNTRSALRRCFARAGFEESLFAKLDDLSAFGKIKWLNALELLAWKAARSVGVSYPENCLLGVYRRLTP